MLVRVAAGKTSREIAEEFGISHRTIETHRESIMRKLQIRTVAGLTRFAMEAELGQSWTAREPGACLNGPAVGSTARTPS